MLAGSILGLTLGTIYGLLDDVLPKDKIKRIISFPLLITIILGPVVIWKMIWGGYITLYIFISMLFWTIIRIELEGKSGKIKKGNILLLSAAFIILISMGAVSLWFGETNPTPDQILGSVTLAGVVGNSNLTGGFTERGKMSILTWPSPSYNDHVDFLGVKQKNGGFEPKPEMGVFSGIYLDERDTMSWFWENDWKKTHRYKNSSPEVFLTVFENPELGMKVTSHSFVLPEDNVLVRNYELEKNKNSQIENFTMLSYSNFHPTTGKIPLLPLSDYFQAYPIPVDFPILKEPRKASFKENSLVFSKIKSSFSNEKSSKTPIYIGATSSAEIGDYQIGTSNERGPQNAFLDCKDGTLSNSSSGTGKVNGAFSIKLDNEKNNVTLYYAVSQSEGKTLKILENARDTPYSTHMKNTENWWGEWLQKAAMPDTNNENIIETAERSLISIRNAYDEKTGSILASVSRQPPYFLDWPRDGAFLNYALDQAGYHKMVEKHNKFYADIQRATGTWGMNYFPDGEEGGPLLFEIDETGLTTWTMWKHYEMTGETSYLENVYPSMKKAANFLASWKDPSSNLHFYAHEDDNPLLTQTINGAVPTYLGLKSAVKAGKILGKDNNTIQKWEKRANNLKKGIEKKLWKPEKGEYKGKGSSWIIWPAELEDFDNSKMKSQAEIVWNNVSGSMKADEVGETDAYEIMGILSLSHMWTDNESKENKLKKSLKWWVENVASQDTNQFGEFHYLTRQDNKLVWKNKVSIPHVWNHALFYSSAMKIYGPKKK